MSVSRSDILIVLDDVLKTIKTEWELDYNYYGNGLNGIKSSDFAAECVQAAIKLITKT